MIELFAKDLPQKLGEQLTNEYSSRLSEIRYLTSGRYDYYTSLAEDLPTISLLLAMSIFYKRIISNFDAATKFTGRVFRSSDASSIQLGRYELTGLENSRITSLVLQFRTLLDQYSIDLSLFDYLETLEFLRKIRAYRDSLNQTNG